MLIPLFYLRQGTFSKVAQGKGGRIQSLKEPSSPSPVLFPPVAGGGGTRRSTGVSGTLCRVNSLIGTRRVCTVTSRLREVSMNWETVARDGMVELTFLVDHSSLLPFTTCGPPVQWDPGPVSTGQRADAHGVCDWGHVKVG